MGLRRFDMDWCNFTTSPICTTVFVLGYGYATLAPYMARLQLFTAKPDFCDCRKSLHKYLKKMWVTSSASDVSCTRQ